MCAAELRVELPDSLSADEVRTLLAVTLYEGGRISLGQAAKMAGFSKRAFMEVLGHHQIPIFSQSAEELRQDLGL